MKKQIAALAGALAIAGTIGVFVSKEDTPPVEVLSSKEYRVTKDTYVIAWNDTRIHAFELQDGRYLATGMPNVEFFDSEKDYKARKEYLHRQLDIPIPEPEPELDRAPLARVEPRIPPRRANKDPTHQPRPALAGYVQRGDRPEYFGVCVGEDCRCSRENCIEALTVYPSGQQPWLAELCKEFPNHSRCARAVERGASTQTETLEISR